MNKTETYKELSPYRIQEDSDIQPQEAFNAFARRAEKNNKRSATRHRVARSLVAGTLLAGGIAAAGESLEGSTPIAASVESSEQEKPLGIMITMRDFQRAGYENVNTLWEVAEKLSSEDRMDPRDIVGEIRDINEIESSDVANLAIDDPLFLESKYANTISELGIKLATKETEEGKPYLGVDLGQ